MYAVIQRKLPQKCKDPGMFTIPCVIRNHRVERAMLGLGASINVMPLLIYKVLNLGPLKETRVIIQLADRSNLYPEGVVEDVLIRINELIFPMDFYIINMDDEFASNSTHILFGRPFIKTARTKIDVHRGILSCEFDGEIVTFNIFYAMKYPNDFEYVFHVDVIDPIVQDEFEQNFLQDELNFVLQQSKTDRDARLENNEDIKETIMSLYSLFQMSNRLVNSPLQLPNSHEKVLLSVEQAPKLELKSLPKHLKYVYLGEGETLSVIIANDLTATREEKLLRVLRENKTVIGWTLAYIKGINPAICMYRFLLKDDAKPVREPQCKLNPTMKEI